MQTIEQQNKTEALPNAEYYPHSRWTYIWLIPLVALLSGGWMVYKTWKESGPVITIRFKDANGIEAGKTKIKFKNVEIGKVLEIQLDQNTMDVKVIAEMNNSFRPYLTDQTRFWVVKARIAASGVTGLETLLSGAYIGVDPIQSGQTSRYFHALSSPPVVTHNIPGKHFLLHTENLGSIERDAPVYYRKFNVGKVEDVQLSDSGADVLIRIFVRAPFDRWVNDTTRFWNASGMDVSLSSHGISVDSESLVSILVGGIAFESDNIEDLNLSVPNESEFKLYANKQDSKEKNYSSDNEFLLYFSESVDGLSIGAPIQFRGIQIGEVKDIQLNLEVRKKDILIPVLVSLDFGKLKFNDAMSPPDSSTLEEQMDYVIDKGIKAQLKSGNLLTGQLYIDVDFFPEAKTYRIDWNTEIPEFPTVPTELKEWTHSLKDILKKVDSTMTEINLISSRLNRELLPEVIGTLQQTNASLQAIETTLHQSSPLQQKVQSSLKEISKAAKSVKNLSDYLERHPEALIQGKQ